MAFHKLNLSSELLTTLDACGYHTPTPIQIQAIPVAMTGKDLIAVAQTGTGKTAAYVLPALHQLQKSTLTSKFRPAQILILLPTRELANQVTDAVRKYGKKLGVRVVSILGGESYRQQLRRLQQGVDVIVSTPGRLIDHLENGKVDVSNIKVLVLDEADRMLDMGFIEDMEYIVNCLPKDRQTMLFTATMDSKVTKIAQKILTKPEHIEVKGQKVSLKQIEQRLCMVSGSAHKSQVLQHLLTFDAPYKAIIFCATKRETDKLAHDLSDLGYSTGALHGDLKQNQRNKIIRSFRDDKLQFLVATDVAARGIDINNISHVINYDLPRQAEDYVHRIGRTGRAGKSGMAISLVTNKELRALRAIEQYIGEKIPHLKITGLTAAPMREDTAPRKKPYKTSRPENKTSRPGKKTARAGDKTARPDNKSARTDRKKSSPKRKEWYGKDKQFKNKKASNKRPGAPTGSGAARVKQGKRPKWKAKK